MSAASNGPEKREREGGRRGEGGGRREGKGGGKGGRDKYGTLTPTDPHLGFLPGDPYKATC